MRVTRPVVTTLLVVLTVLPLLFGLAEVFRDPSALSELLFSERILRLWGASLLLGTAVATGAALLGVPVGWLLARTSGPAAAVITVLLPMPLILPPWIAGVAWMQVLPLTGFWGSTFLLAVSLWPVVTLFALRGFRAARRAGDAAALARGRTAAFRAVELPLALPSILAGTLLVFAFAITDFGVVDYLSFASKNPFVVLSSEVFQRWARLDSGPGAAAVSIPAIVSTAVALGLLLQLEARSTGRDRGPQAPRTRPLPAGRAGVAVLLLAGVLVAVPVVVLAIWSFDAADKAAALAAARDPLLRSLGMSIATGVCVALLGTAVAWQTLPLRGARLVRSLALVVLPLSAPGILFAVGEIRLWNAPWNPLADAVYPSSALLVLALTGRYLCLGVLAARVVLLRLDRSPFDAARLVARPGWRRVLSVHLPMLAPATGLAFALGYILAMRELDMIVLIPAGSGTLEHHIFALVHIAADGLVAMLCTVLVLLVVVPAAAARLLGVPGIDCGGTDGRP